MANFYAQASVASTSGQARDSVVNGFALGQIGEIDLTSAEAWVAVIKQFYEDCKTAGAMRGSALTGHLVKIYTITGTQPNYPKFEIPWSFGLAPSDIDLPREVSLCVSYVNTLATTVARARRRGRIYISGWSETQNDAGRPTAGTVTALREAYSDYVLAANALTTLEAGVWSRTEGVVYPVDTVYVDNEWDTMRSRGGRATVRDTWELP